MKPVIWLVHVCPAGVGAFGGMVLFWPTLPPWWMPSCSCPLWPHQFSAEVDVPEVTKPINSMDAEDSHVSSGGSPSVPEVEVTPGPSGVSLLAAVEGMDGVESENESVVDNVTLDDENITEESSSSMENANEINVVKDNVINVVKDNVTNVVKEKGTNVVKEKGTNVVKENGINVVKENGIKVVKENGINVVKENGINVVKENEINEETSDLGSQESGSMECSDSPNISSFSSSS